MRYFLHIFILFIFSVKGVSQENTTASIKIMGDSILKVYELKNDFDTWASVTEGADFPKS